MSIDYSHYVLVLLGKTACAAFTLLRVTYYTQAIHMSQVTSHMTIYMTSINLH